MTAPRTKVWNKMGTRWCWLLHWHCLAAVQVAARPELAAWALRLDKYCDLPALFSISCHPSLAWCAELTVTDSCCQFESGRCRRPSRAGMYAFRGPPQASESLGPQPASDWAEWSILHGGQTWTLSKESLAQLNRRPEAWCPIPRARPLPRQVIDITGSTARPLPAASLHRCLTYHMPREFAPILLTRCAAYISESGRLRRATV